MDSPGSVKNNQLLSFLTECLVSAADVHLPPNQLYLSAPIGYTLVLHYKRERYITFKLLVIRAFKKIMFPLVQFANDDWLYSPLSLVSST